MTSSLEIVSTLRRHGVRSEQDLRGNLPEGFSMVGGGCTRTVVRFGRVVVKVGDEDANRVEVQKTRTMRNDPNLPEWCYVPEAEFVDGVCVQEYVEGLHLADCWSTCICGLSPCWQRRRKYLETQYNLHDLHCENMLYRETEDDYMLILFDLGCGMFPQDYL
jgi:hypothetical protein